MIASNDLLNMIEGVCLGIFTMNIYDSIITSQLISLKILPYIHKLRVRVYFEVYPAMLEECIIMRPA